MENTQTLELDPTKLRPLKENLGTKPQEKVRAGLNLDFGHHSPDLSGYSKSTLCSTKLLKKLLKDNSPNDYTAQIFD